MNVDIQNLSSTRSIFHITASADEVKSAHNGALKALIQSATVPGFRKGKTPAAVIEKKFGDKLSQNTRERTMQESYRTVLKDHAELKVVEIISAEKYEVLEDGSATFDITVDLEPRFELPSLEGIPVDNKDTVVTEEQVEEQLKSFHHSLGKFEDVEEGYALQNEDMASIDYEGTVDGKSVSEAYAECDIFSKKEGAWCTVGSKYFAVPTFPELLIGKKVGETGTADVTFPEDFYKECLRNVTVSYTYTVKSARKMVLPELNEETLARYQMKTVEEVRERIRTYLEKSAKETDFRRRTSQITDYLLSKTTIDLPQSLLEHETERQLSNLLRSNMDQGLSKEDLSKEREALTEQAKATAEKMMRFRFLAMRVVAALDVKLTDEEFTEYVNTNEQLLRAGAKFAQSFLKDRNNVNMLYAQALQEKAFKLLVEKAAPSDSVQA